jgi:hypothetical protein
LNLVELLSMTPTQLITCLLLVAHLAEAGPLVFTAARPVSEMNSMFEQKDNWIGADGAYSVALTPQRTLWLFSDTWVGSVRDGKRTNATIVNNSLALQDGRDAQAKLQFIIRHDAKGKPIAFLTPDDKTGWFWLQAGACIEKRLFLFLTQVERTDTNSVFGFRQIGQWLGVVANPLDPPSAWRVEQRKLPWAGFLPERQVTFGAAALVDGESLYIYGTDEDIKTGSRDRHLIVARVRTREAADFSAWRFYVNGKWDEDYRKASRIADDMASECSVSFLPKLGQYVLVFTDRGLSAKIQARTASTPWGTWSAPTTVYQCPEMGRDKNIFCYAAKAHSSLGTSDEMIISYVANSFSFWQVANDAGLYWPRFIRVQLALGEKQERIQKSP